MKHLNYKFTPNEGFFCEELKSHYVAGLNYTVRQDCEVLDGLIDGWLEAGLIQATSAHVAKVEGE